jgi:hypothetical protein
MKNLSVSPYNDTGTDNSMHIIDDQRSVGILAHKHCHSRFGMLPSAAWKRHG